MVAVAVNVSVVLPEKVAEVGAKVCPVLAGVTVTPLLIDEPAVIVTVLVPVKGSVGMLDAVRETVASTVMASAARLANSPALVPPTVYVIGIFEPVPLLVTVNVTDVVPDVNANTEGENTIPVPAGVSVTAEVGADESAIVITTKQPVRMSVGYDPGARSNVFAARIVALVCEAIVETPHPLTP